MIASYKKRRNNNNNNNKDCFHIRSDGKNKKKLLQDMRCDVKQKLEIIHKLFDIITVDHL